MGAALDAAADARRRAAARFTSDRSDAGDVLAALENNAALLERWTRPLAEALPAAAPRAPRFRLSDLVARYASGWTPERLLPWLAVDWMGTEAFRVQSADVLDALGRFARRRAGAVVLGCGGAGLVAALAGSFEEIAGIDLSLVTLLAARRLLDGEGIEVRLADARCGKAVLHGASRAVANATLVAADALDLPLPDGGLDAVTTQYLLDLVPDAGALAAEVNRVLAPGGVWVVVGPPFRPRTDPAILGPRRAADLAPFFEEHGFSPLALEEKKYTLLDLSAVDPYVGGTRKPVIFAVLRKSRELPTDPVREAFLAFARGETAPLLGATPRLAPGAAIHALRGTARDAAGARPASEVRLDTAVRSDVLPVSADLLDFLDALFGAMDGTRTVAGALEHVRRVTNVGLEEADFATALRGLVKLGLVELA